MGLGLTAGESVGLRLMNRGTEAHESVGLRLKVTQSRVLITYGRPRLLVRRFGEPFTSLCN